MVSTQKGKRYANEQLENETPPPKMKQKKPRQSKPVASNDEARALSDHKKSIESEVVHKLCLPAAPSQFDVPSISLSALIEYAVQNTLRQITILSELLPKKKDDNKSVRVRHLVQFAGELHALFAKLLAVVKWLQTSGEVEKLSSINHFLKQQSASIVEAADKLVSIDIRELHFARLPAFSVDALAAGYTKEDLDVRRKQEESFENLHHIIGLQSALYAQPIASRFNTIDVINGMVILGVSGEFEVNTMIAKKRKS